MEDEYGPKLNGKDGQRSSSARQIRSRSGRSTVTMRSPSADLVGYMASFICVDRFFDIFLRVCLSLFFFFDVSYRRRLLKLTLLVLFLVHSIMFYVYITYK